MRRAPGDGGPTVTYLTKRFPRLSETFILDEILGLERAGVRLALYAVADPGESTIQPDVESVKSRVSYLRHAGLVGFLGDVAVTAAAHLETASRNPRRYVAAVRVVLEGPHHRTQIRHFLLAGRLCASMRRNGSARIHAAFAHTPRSIAHYVQVMSGAQFSFAAHAKDLYRSDPVHLAHAARQASFVLVCSGSAAAALRDLTAGDARIVLAYHGVDTARFSPAVGRPEPRGEVRLLAVGRLVEKKGYPVLLEAMGRLVPMTPGVRLQIIGGGDLGPMLTREIEQLGLSGVVSLLGARTHQEIAAAYREADVFVQASVVLADGDRDGIPNSLLEAMASGLAVVASDVAGIPEAVTDAKTGLLVPPGDPVALATALHRVTADAALRGRLGAAARRHVAEHQDREVCAAQVAELFAPRSQRVAHEHRPLSRSHRP